MNAFAFDRVTFSYAGVERPVLLDVSLEVPEGAFVLLTGATGSGKSTLLRLAKPEIAPAGELSGTVRAFGEDVRSLDAAASARAVGYVFQSPDAQMVCDTVWHEMAFGLENLGTPEAEMRRRVAETATYLGMGPWFRDRVAELSGGRRQVLALASVLAMRPRALLLDEPTSMLDPVTEQAFLALLFRANRELGMTVVVATHAPAPMLDYATCAFALEGGRVREVALEELRRQGDSLVPEDQNGMAEAPTLAPQRQRVFLAGEKDARPALSLDDVWFRYDRDADWVLRSCDLSVGAGVVLLVIAEIGLVSIPAVGIYGAPISTLICYAVALGFNMHFLSKTQRLRLNVLRMFAKPAFCAALSAACAFGTYRLVYALLGSESRPACALMLIASVAVAVAVYVITMLAVRGIRENEVRLLPCGNRFADYLIRKGMLRPNEKRS